MECEYVLLARRKKLLNKARLYLFDENKIQPNHSLEADYTRYHKSIVVFYQLVFLTVLVTNGCLLVILNRMVPRRINFERSY